MTTDSPVQDRPRARPRPRATARPVPPPPHTETERGTPRYLTLVAVLSFALAAFAGHGWYAHRKLEAARAQAVAAASAVAQQFVSISAATVDSDLAGVAAAAGGSFGRDLIRSGARLRAKVLADNVQATGRLLRAGLVSGGLESAAVLVAVDATIRDARTPDGRSAHYRMRLDLAYQGERWLVTGLRYV